MKPKQRNGKVDLSYYLDLFKIEGHDTWRASLKGDKEAFEREMKNNNQKTPVITARMTYRVDRLTGEITKI